VAANTQEMGKVGLIKPAASAAGAKPNGVGVDHRGWARAVSGKGLFIVPQDHYPHGLVQARYPRMLPALLFSALRAELAYRQLLRAA